MYEPLYLLEIAESLKQELWDNTISKQSGMYLGYQEEDNSLVQPALLQSAHRGIQTPKTLPVLSTANVACVQSRV